MIQLLERMKSYIALINGILILIIFFKGPIIKWWLRNIISRFRKLEFELAGKRKRFNCIQKELVSSVEFDCPDEIMDDGSIHSFQRGYRFRVNALFRGLTFCNLLSNIPNEQLKIIYNDQEIPMHALFISNEGKDTKVLAESSRILKKAPSGTVVKINPPSADYTERFIASALLHLNPQSWDQIYRGKILESEKRYKKL